MHGENLEERRRVEDGTSNRPDLIECAGEGNHSIPREAPVGWLEPHCIGQRCRLADASSGIGSQGAEYLPSSDSCGGAAGRAPWRATQIPRIVGGKESGGFSRRAHRELVLIQLAEDRQAGAFEKLHCGGVVGRNESGEDFRSSGGLHPLGKEEVFHRDRNSIQRAQRSRLSAVIRGLCRGECALRVDPKKGLDPRIYRFNAAQAGMGRLDGRDFAPRQRPSQLKHGQVQHRRRHSMIFGTAKLVPTLSGALASALAGSIDGTTTSSRSTESSAIACEVGGTSLVSRALSCSMASRMADSWWRYRSSSSGLSDKRARAATCRTSCSVSFIRHVASRTA